MADTSQQELSEPHTNGVVDGLTEEEKSKMRPADIDADMREMERRKRVEMMMNSRLFREELERIIETQMKDGAGASGLLQQISDMMGAQGARFNANMFKNSNCVVPINDIRGVESMGYAKGEKVLRCKLAAVFRLLDLYGWTQGVGGQITARLNQDQEHFLVNPYGLLYHEVTASSLVKVDMQGAIVEQGTTNFGVHITGFQLHSTIHAARPDIKCIVHISTPSVTAISSLKCGLLPLGQESIVIGDVSTHQYMSGSLEPEEREKIARNLGPINKVMLLTNRGALCCGESVEEAFFNVYNTVLACETQLKLMPVGIDNLSLISDESKKAIFEASRKPPVPQQSSVAEPSPLAEKLEKRWRIGGTEFEALMRMLDNAGFRTGYIYRHPLVKSEPPRPRNDVEVPPAVSSLGYLIEEEDLYKQGLWKGGRKGTDRSRWLNSPNVYQKVEILETGTPDPKKITKWVSDGSPTHSSTPVKIDSALQFVPKNTNPKEFKQIQQQIKDYRRADKISAGPQSHILEGVSWEEAKKMQDATISGTGEQVVLVGAASKGIIQRGFQHNAMVYKTPYAKNPFDAVTDQELDQYKKEVERKQKGDPYDESQSESEALSSFNASRATHESSTAKSPIQSPVSVTSETEEESRDEPRVLRIETRQVPAPSQPEVVLSDADATTEFLNEMRRSALDPQNDHSSKKDSRISSACSNSIISSTYSNSNRSLNTMNSDSIWLNTEPYEILRLEVARIATIAERKRPVLMDLHPPAKKICDSRISAVATSKAKLTDILKRAFLDKYDETIQRLSSSSNEKFASKLSKINSQTMRRNYLNSLPIRDESNSEIDENRLPIRASVESTANSSSEIAKKCCDGTSLCFDCRRVRFESLDFFGNTTTTTDLRFPNKCKGSKSFENLVTSGDNWFRDRSLRRSKKTKSFEFRENSATIRQRIEPFVVATAKERVASVGNNSTPVGENLETVNSQNVPREISNSSGKEEILVGVETAEVEYSPNVEISKDFSNEKLTELEIGVAKINEKSAEDLEKNATVAEEVEEFSETMHSSLTEKEPNVETSEDFSSEKSMGLKMESIQVSEINEKSAENFEKNATVAGTDKESLICSSLTDKPRVNSESPEALDSINEKNASNEDLEQEEKSEKPGIVEPGVTTGIKISDTSSKPARSKKRSPKNRESLSGTIRVDLKKLKLLANSETVEGEVIQGDNFTKETEDFLRDLIWEEEVRKYAEDRSSGSDDNKKAAHVTSRNFNPIWNEKMLRYFQERCMAEPEDSLIEDTPSPGLEIGKKVEDNFSKGTESLEENTSMTRGSLDEIAREEEKTGFNRSSDEGEEEKARNDPESEEVFQTNALEREDSMSDVLKSIKTNIMSSKIVFEPLPETDNSVKYNLDSTNMSLIYSLTPTGDVQSQASEDTCFELSNGALTAKSNLSLATESTINDVPAEAKDENDDDDDDNNSCEFYWYDLAAEAKRVSREDLHETLDNPFDDNSSTGNFSEISNQASDILELPHQTVRELRENESFHLDMNETVNEILADLDPHEGYSKTVTDVVVNQIVDEILSGNVRSTLKDDVRKLVVRKLESLRVANDACRAFVEGLPSDRSDDWKRDKGEEGNDGRRTSVSLTSDATLMGSICESENENESFQSASTFVGEFLVVEEIVHHIIDKVEYKRRRKIKQREAKDCDLGATKNPVDTRNEVSRTMKELESFDKSLSNLKKFSFLDETPLPRRLSFSRTRHLSLEKDLDDPSRDSFITVSSFHESFGNVLEDIYDTCPFSDPGKSHLYRSYCDVRNSVDAASPGNFGTWICPCSERFRGAREPEPLELEALKLEPGEASNSSLAVLEFCSMAIPTEDSKELELNFEVERFEENGKSSRRSFEKIANNETIHGNLEKLEFGRAKLSSNSRESLPNEQQSSLSENNAELELTSSDSTSSDFEWERRANKCVSAFKLNDYIGTECEKPEVQSVREHLELSLEWNRSFDFESAPNEENNNNNNDDEVADLEKDDKSPVCTCCLEGDIVYDNGTDNDFLIINYNSNLSSLPSISEEEDEAENEEEQTNVVSSKKLPCDSRKFGVTDSTNARAEFEFRRDPCAQTNLRPSLVPSFPTISEETKAEVDVGESFESEIIQCLEERASSWRSFLSPRSLGNSSLNVQEDPSSPEYFSCKDDSSNFPQSDEERGKESGDSKIEEEEEEEEKNGPGTETLPNGKCHPGGQSLTEGGPKLGHEILEKGSQTELKIPEMIIELKNESFRDESPGILARSSGNLSSSSSSPSTSSSFSSEGAESGLNRTYTISESSKSSDRNESPTYNADVSGNIDESGSNADPTRRKFRKGREEGRGDFGFDTAEKRRNENCMTVSYDTEEFLIIEKAIKNEEEESDVIRDCHRSFDIFTVSPLNPLPKYEDTTLCKVISEINLTDSAGSRE